MKAATVRLLHLLVVLPALAVTSCGLPAEDEPHEVELPRHPLTTPVDGAPGAVVGGEVAEVICLVRDGRIVQVVRRVDSPPSAQRQLEHLVEGPTDSERLNGLSTALTATGLTVDVPAGATQARVQVADAEEGSVRNDETIAYGQVVCTLTTRLDVTSVVFIRDGDVLQVPRADGSLSSEPLRGSDYASLIGPS